MALEKIKQLAASTAGGSDGSDRFGGVKAGGASDRFAGSKGGKGSDGKGGKGGDGDGGGKRGGGGGGGKGGGKGGGSGKGEGPYYKRISPADAIRMRLEREALEKQTQQ